jgi:hypothetical protein
VKASTVVGLLLGTLPSMVACARSTGPAASPAVGTEDAGAPGKGAESAAERCRVAAAACVLAARSADADKLIDCMPDEVVDFLGGHDALVSKTRVLEAEISKHGVVIESVDATPPSQLRIVGDTTFAVVPEVTALRVDGQELDIHTYLLAVSHDGGRRWKFVDGQGVTPRLLGSVYPLFPSDLPLPTPGKPTRRGTGSGSGTDTPLAPP